MCGSVNLHKAYPGTGSICTGVAALIEGTIVSELTADAARETGNVFIGHPSGILDVDIELEQDNRQMVLKKGMLGRTARRIMEGYVYLKPTTL